jgi:hypothetical protein
LAGKSDSAALGDGLPLILAVVLSWANADESEKNMSMNFIAIGGFMFVELNVIDFSNIDRLVFSSMELIDFYDKKILAV